MLLLLFCLLGFFVAAIGTLVGAGGGFILVPVLIFLMPDVPTSHITAISTAVVFFNALSGSISYGLMKKIDYKSGIIFAICAIPGSFFGAYMTRITSRQLFDMVFAIFLAGLAIFLMRKTLQRRKEKSTSYDPSSTQPPLAHKLIIGSITSLFVGFLASMLGIGGGIVHVPFLIYQLHYPPHIATATSHFILAISNFVAFAQHFSSGSYSSSYSEVLALSFGAILGAQVGAQLSKKVKDKTILLGLSIALFCASARILFRFL